MPVTAEPETRWEDEQDPERDAYMRNRALKDLAALYGLDVSADDDPQAWEGRVAAHLLAHPEVFVDAIRALCEAAELRVVRRMAEWLRADAAKSQARGEPVAAETAREVAAELDLQCDEEPWCWQMSVFSGPPRLAAFRRSDARTA